MTDSHYWQAPPDQSPPDALYMVDYKVLDKVKGVVNTIQLIVDVCDLDCEESKTITMPCNLRAELGNHYDYIILSTTPNIPLSKNDDINRLNEILDDINSENPGMTEDYLSVLLGASPSGDLFDPEFVRKLKENDFIFEDISCIRWMMSAKETAACYLATELMVPFDHGITDEMLSILGNDALTDYINWEQVWDQYASVGFQVIEPNAPGGGRYIVHIK